MAYITGMARWELLLRLDREKGVPLFQQIARAIAEEIGRGRLKPGQRLPGTRTLARAVGVQRLTVVAAMEELAAEGWIVSRPARGTFVSADVPEPRPAGAPAALRRGVPDRVLFALPPSPPGDMPYPGLPGALFFAPNRADARLIPHDVIGRAYGRAIRREGAVLLAYGRPQGHQRLRQAV
ncbi:MAG TPA: GntR family transcriptional regulator, partial [Vicinamibacteria bacterium]|nr:GntR family transcriptional regulator [Vicinamibacteria bacterium]